VEDFLRIHVVWADGSNDSAALAEIVSAHFDGIGMERDGVAFRVPVRFASAPWTPSGMPRQLNLEKAVHNAVVLLFDDYMNEARDAWGNYVEALHGAMTARGNADVYIPLGSVTSEQPLDPDWNRKLHYARRSGWAKTLHTPDAIRSRFLLHIVFVIRQHLRTFLGGPPGEPLFVSHAKLDGDRTAKSIVDYVNRSGNDVPLETFYDAMELAPGEDFEGRFKAEISHGTLLAIVSDVYDTRPWCVFELTEAKRTGRPVVLADVGRVRTSRTFPYGANLPRVRISPLEESDEWVEPLLVQTLSEGLRCDLFMAQTDRVLHAQKVHDALVLPRPPELFDVVERVSDQKFIVYPDPPLGRIERELVMKSLDLSRKPARLVTLSEVQHANS
jgi:hypothetical protein